MDIVRYLGSLDLATRQRGWQRDRDLLSDRFFDGYRRGLVEPEYRAPEPDLVRELRSKAPATRATYLAYTDALMQPMQPESAKAVVSAMSADATGARFNSIIAVEAVKTVVGTGAPEMNPLVNPGAISATSMVTGATSDEVWKKIIGFHNDAAGRQLSVLQDGFSRLMLGTAARKLTA